MVHERHAVPGVGVNVRSGLPTRSLTCEQLVRLALVRSVLDALPLEWEVLLGRARYLADDRVVAWAPREVEGRVA